MQDRQRKRGGLAGPGLGYSNRVAARQEDGNGLGLDRGGSDVFFFGKSSRNRFGKAKVMKGGQ